MEAAYLLSRTEVEKTKLDELHVLFNDESDEYVQVAMSMILVQNRTSNEDIIQSLVFHPNEKVRNAGKLFRTAKNDINYAKAELSG